jgi:beta-glucanase (GH16 family)
MGYRTLAAATLLAGCLAGTTLAGTSLAGAAAAQAGPAPAARPGWTRVFNDNFTGRAGSPPSRANWFYDLGTNFGTGEIEQTTASTSNVYLNGHGQLVLRAIEHDGRWTSARIESTRDDFEAPPGGELRITASIEQPRTANGLGYWPAFWALGSPMRAGGGWPVSGEIDMMEDVNGLNQASQTLHDGAGSSGHPLIACRGSSCEGGYHIYSVIISRVSPAHQYLQFLMGGRVQDTVTEASVGAAAWRAAIDHGFFIIFDLAMGGNYPDGECSCTAPAAATSSGGAMRVASVAVYELGGNSTPRARATATGRVHGAGGLCLTNQAGLNTEGNPIDLLGCRGGQAQRWSVYSDRTLRAEGGCLDVAGAGTASGTAVDWYPCNGTVAQVWVHRPGGKLVNPHSGLCLTAPGGDARLDIATCDRSSAQRWSLPG